MPWRFKYEQTFHEKCLSLRQEYQTIQLRDFTAV